METGAITSYIDVAQLTLYAFWLFFAGLIYYLHQENKREGYPLVSDRSGQVLVQGFPPLPKPKAFLLRNGHVYHAPPGNVETREPAGVAENFPGAPLRPTGNPLLDAIGPASYALREEHPELTAEGDLRCVPIRVATDFDVERNDADPRGMEIVAADRKIAGVVRDLWIDRSEPQIRYLEVEVPTAAGGRRVLVPMTFAVVNARKGIIHVNALLAHQFADVPGTAHPDQVTAREEDRITGYFGGGYLYATRQRAEPLI